MIRCRERLGVDQTHGSARFRLHGSVMDGCLFEFLSTEWLYRLQRNRVKEVIL